MAICGGIVLEEALNLSSDRLLDDVDIPVLLDPMYQFVFHTIDQTDLLHPSSARRFETQINTEIQNKFHPHILARSYKNY